MPSSARVGAVSSKSGNALLPVLPGFAPLFLSVAASSSPRRRSGSNWEWTNCPHRRTSSPRRRSGQTPAFRTARLKGTRLVGARRVQTSWVRCYGGVRITAAGWATRSTSQVVAARSREPSRRIILQVLPAGWQPLPRWRQRHRPANRMRL